MRAIKIIELDTFVRRPAMRATTHDHNATGLGGHDLVQDSQGQQEVPDVVNRKLALYAIRQPEFR